MASWHGKLFQTAHYFWKNLRAFAFYNRTIFEIFFVLLYASEQAVLIWLVSEYPGREEMGLIIPLFALIVLTTFSLHKLVMESRIKQLEEDVHSLQQEKFSLTVKANEAKEIFQEIYNELSQERMAGIALSDKSPEELRKVAENLNKPKLSKNKRGG